MAKYEMSPDEDFINFAKAKGKEIEEQQNKKPFTPFATNYETIKYTAPDKDKPAVVRLIGSLKLNNESRTQPYEMKTLTISKILDDNGKKMLLYMPSKNENKEFIIWRIIRAVMEKKWDADGKDYYVNETKHPEIFSIINKGGFSKDSTDFKYSKGWQGDSRVLINCIDRLDNWCKENNHTKLLSRNISYGENDKGEKIEYPETGINSYSFFNALQTVITSDPNVEKFDVCIKRTGTQTNPYMIMNASKFKEAGFKTELGLTDENFAKISLEKKMTEEELSYDRYDLDKLFPITSYTKILKRLGNTIKKIDGALNRNFYNELVDLAAKEEKERELKKEVEEDNKAEEIAEVAEKTETKPAEIINEAVSNVRTRQSAQPAETSPSNDFSALLGGWNVLTDEEKAKIKNVTKDANGKLAIEYDCGNETIYECPDEKCQCKSPESFTHCPACGLSYN